MKRTLGMICAALACSAVAATAQMEKKMDDSVTVTGCVAAATSGGGYLLNNATNSGQMAMEHDKMAMTAKDKMAMAGKDKMARTEQDKMAMEMPATLSYALAGGGDLRPHLGHKVEIAGTVPKAMDRMAREPMASKDMNPATLTVKSVTMISATCP